MKKLFIIIKCIFFSELISAQGFLYQSANPDTQSKYEKYIKNVVGFADSSGRYDINVITKGNAEHLFIPKDSIVFADPKVKAYWIRFKLKKEIDSTLIISLNPAYSVAEYYYFTKDHYKVERAGFTIRNKSNNALEIPDILFQIANTDTASWHYLKISPFSDMAGLGFAVFPSTYLARTLPNNYFKYGLFFGIVVFTFLFNLNLYRQIKQVSHLYYSLYTLAFGIYAAVEWQLFKIFQLGHYKFTFLFYSVPFIAMTIFLLLYLKSFFPIEPRFKRIRQVSLIMLWVRIGLYLFALIFKINAILLSTLIDIICILLPFLFVLHHAKTFKPARYLALAIGLIFIGYVAHFEFLAKIQFLRNTFTIQNLGILEILLLSYALGSKIMTSESEKAFNQELLMVELREKQIFKDKLNLELEEQVEKRTLEINKLNKFLKDNNLELEAKVESLVSARVMQEYVSLEEFKKIFSTDESCYLYLSDLKWKDGFICRFCKASKHTSINKPQLFAKRCLECFKIDSPTSNTIFHKLKFPIQKAFYILFVVTSGQKISNDELAGQVDLRAATCFTFKKKIIDAMEQKQVKRNQKRIWSDWILP